MGIRVFGYLGILLFLISCSSTRYSASNSDFLVRKYYLAESTNTKILEILRKEKIELLSFKSNPNQNEGIVTFQFQKNMLRLTTSQIESIKKENNDMNVRGYSTYYITRSYIGEINFDRTTNLLSIFNLSQYDSKSDSNTVLLRKILHDTLSFRVELINHKNEELLKLYSQ